MLTRKGNLICKSLVFIFAVITAMTMDSCCDDCLGSSKGNNNHNPFDNKNNNNLINNNPKHGGTETSDEETKTSNEDKETAGFKKTKDEKFFWIFGTPLFYSAKDGKLRFGDKEVTTSIFRYIISNYLTGFNSNYKNITKIEDVSEVSGFDSIKVVLCGDVGVGKTQICNINFKEEYTATIGADFVRKNFCINNNDFFMRIWDTSGWEGCRSIIKAYLCSKIIILVYDVTNKEISKYLDKWYNEIKNTAPEGAAIFVVGNKCDLIEKDKISAQVKAVDKWIKDKCEQK